MATKIQLLRGHQLQQSGNRHTIVPSIPNLMKVGPCPLVQGTAMFQECVVDTKVTTQQFNEKKPGNVPKMSTTGCVVWTGGKVLALC